MITPIASGAVLFPRYLDLDQQKLLLAQCVELGCRSAGFYRPIVRGGGQMHVEMMCLGLLWNAKTYSYERRRSDYDGLPVEPLPERWRTLARGIAAAAGMSLEPELCIMNFYSDDGRMGLHQDKDESPETLEHGVPVV